MAIEGDTRHLRVWGIETDSFDEDRIRYFESLMTQGNGYLGVRGAFEERLPEVDCPLILVA